MAGPDTATVEAGMVAWFKAAWAALALDPDPPIKEANAPFDFGSEDPDEDPDLVGRDHGHVELTVLMGGSIPQEIGAGYSGGRYDQVGVLVVAALQIKGNGTGRVGPWLDSAENIMRASRNRHSISGYNVRFTNYTRTEGGEAGDRYERQLAATFEYQFLQP